METAPFRILHLVVHYQEIQNFASGLRMRLLFNPLKLFDNIIFATLIVVSHSVIQLKPIPKSHNCSLLYN